jgi:hypothetical protein
MCWAMSDPLLTGRNENAPFHVLNRVFLVVAGAVVVIGALAYILWSALN